MKTKDLTKEPPRSPHERLGGYAILARTIDKARATVEGRIGEYHFDCPLDRMLFSFKGVDAQEFLRQVKNGKADEQLVIWMDESGVPKTPEEIEKWSDAVEEAKPYDDPDRREWFAEQCQPLGLGPKTTTLFDWLDADDHASFAVAHK
jgi:hypothetical protein